MLTASAQLVAVSDGRTKSALAEEALQLGAMNKDRLKWIRIEGFRSIEDLTLSIEDLQVLIGENGSGKSTIIEAFEILTLLENEQRFTVEFAARHGSLRDLMRVGSSQLRLSLRIENDSAPQHTAFELEYGVTLAASANSPYPMIVDEELVSSDIVHFKRDSVRASVLVPAGDPVVAPDLGPRQKEAQPPSEASMMKFWGAEGPVAVRRLRSMIEGFRIHVPFETKPSWARTSNRDAPPSLRDLAQMEESDRLIRGGLNLTAIFQQLNAEGASRHQEILEDIQLGLGFNVLDFGIRLKGRFSVLNLKFRGSDWIPMSQLSEGQIAFLGIVALRHFVDRKATLVLFDEPELHLNPALVVRAAGLFLQLSKRVPVVLATHSEALFDSLDPLKHVRVLGLVEQKTIVRTLSPEKFEKWHELYSTVGDARRDGRLEELLAEPLAS